MQWGKIILSIDDAGIICYVRKKPSHTRPYIQKWTQMNHRPCKTKNCKLEQTTVLLGKGYLEMTPRVIHKTAQ